MSKPSLIDALLLVGTLMSAMPAAAEPGLTAQIEDVARDAESMAIRSGQPSQSVVFEIAKAVRNVVWSSGEPPSAVLAALDAVEASITQSPTTTQALEIVKHEMAEK